MESVATLDEGAEVNCMNLKFAKKCNVNIATARIEAQAAGSTDLCVIGQSQNPVTIEVDFSGIHIPIHLGHKQSLITLVLIC